MTCGRPGCQQFLNVLLYNLRTAQIRFSRGGRLVANKALAVDQHHLRYDSPVHQAESQECGHRVARHPTDRKIRLIIPRKRADQIVCLTRSTSLVGSVDRYLKSLKSLTAVFL